MRFSIILMLILGNPSFGFTQTKTDSIAAVKAVNTLINLCKAGEHGKAAVHILYNGKDEKTAFKIISDYRKKEHRHLVDDFCMEIKDYVIDSESSAIDQYYTDMDNEVTWHILEFICKYEGNKKRKISFEFLKIKGKLLLGGISNNPTY